MDLLDVDPAGLTCLAAQCQTWSTEVALTGAPTESRGAFQASAAAVTAVHTKAGLTGQRLSARMAATAGHLGTAAAAYRTQDADASVRLGDLAPVV